MLLLLEKGRVLIDDSLVAVLDLLLDLHVRHVLHVLEVVVEAGTARLAPSDELVLEEDNVVLVVLCLALVAAGHLALVAGEHDLMPVMLSAVRLRRRVLLTQRRRAMDVQVVGLALGGMLLAT